jgi:hypothetical protein
VGELASSTTSPHAAEPVRFGPAVLSVFLGRAVGSTVVGLFSAALPYRQPYADDPWSRYVLGYSLAACVIGAFFVPLVLRLFRYEISYAAALVALFAGVIAANFLFALLISNTPHSPYFGTPFSSTYGAIGGIVSLLVSGWLVVELSKRRQKRRRRDAPSAV